MDTKPLIIAYFDGDEEVKILSNFSYTPFSLDSILYNSVEAFWQSLKTEIPDLREQIYPLYGLAAKKAGRLVASSSNLFTYNEKIYKVGSEAHHILLERALRAKFEQHEGARNALLNTGDRLLKHMIKNKYGQFRVGDSPALPAIVFETMLMKIRKELQTDTFISTLTLPRGLNEFNG